MFARVGVARIVSGKPVRDLTSGEDGGGEDDSEDVCTKTEVVNGGGVDAGGCKLARRGRGLAFVWYAALRIDRALCHRQRHLVCARSTFNGLSPRASSRRFLRGLVVGV